MGGGDLVAVTPLEVAEHVVGGGDDQLGIGVGVVPLLDGVGEVHVGRAVVPEAVADLDEVVGIAALLQPPQVVHQIVRRTEDPVVAGAGHPDEHPVLAVGADPPERFIAPRRDGVSDAVTAVGADGPILHAAVGEGGHHAPGVARHIGNHGGSDGRVAQFADALGAAHKAHEFLRAAEAGEFVAIERLEAHLARLYSFYELLALFRGGLLNVAVHGPEDFHVPLETRPRRVVR